MRWHVHCCLKRRPLQTLKAYYEKPEQDLEVVIECFSRREVMLHSLRNSKFHLIYACLCPAATSLLCLWGQVADQYGYNISVFVVDNSDPDTALSDLELLTSYTHFELVVLGAEIDFCIKQALRQVRTHALLSQGSMHAYRLLAWTHIWQKSEDCYSERGFTCAS